MARCYVCRWIMWPWTRAHTVRLDGCRVFAHENCVDLALARLDEGSATPDQPE